MQWTDGEGAGFTEGTPWLRPTNQDRINVVAEESGGRILPYYRRLIALRKRHEVIAKGSFTPHELDHPRVMAYVRRRGGRALLVLCNFFGEPCAVTVPAEFLSSEVLISNYPAAPVAAEMVLAPYQATALLV